MNYYEFQRRITHNTKALKAAIASKEPVINVLSKLYTWDTKPGELNSSFLLQKGHDMLPAVYLGLLANVKRTGADAFKLQKNNRKIDYELKTSEVNSKDIWRTSKGTLYLGENTRTRKICLKSRLTAQYSFFTQANIDTKNLRTVLLVSDFQLDGYVDAYELDGETVVSYIKKTSNPKRTIKLCTFQMLGKRADTVVDLVGFDNWANKLRKKAPIAARKITK